MKKVSRLEETNAAGNSADLTTLMIEDSELLFSAGLVSSPI
jgi:hypothetical protein